MLGRFFIDALRETSDRMFELANGHSGSTVNPSAVFDVDYDKDRDEDEREDEGSEKSSEGENNDEEKEGGPIGEIGDGIPGPPASGLRVTIKKPVNVPNVPAVRFFIVIFVFRNDRSRSFSVLDAKNHPTGFAIDWLFSPLDTDVVYVPRIERSAITAMFQAFIASQRK
jgi:hypothetical protein